MDTIIAPGRIKYITGEKKEGCIFCADSLRDERLMLHKGKHCFVIMNKYPYTSGHLMVVPYRHIADIADASTEELMELMNLTGRAVDILRKAFNPEGFNVGMNLGKAAGAGVDEHMHMHVVPRWFGDTNFVTVLGEVRVIPEEIEKTRDLLKSFF
ncbi:MAG TPA: HIT domain-containing protein [Deltaproteobacteria bacterium]|nr:HIT domain-containing protein [Deltaproteobacteria bacterium]